MRSVKTLFHRKAPPAELYISKVTSYLGIVGLRQSYFPVNLCQNIRGQFLCTFANKITIF